MTGLTSRGEVLIFESCGNPATNKWRLWCNLSQVLAKDLGILETGESSESEVQEARIHSIEWTARYMDESKWGAALLLLGTENGNVLAYKTEREGKLKLLQRFHVVDGWVVGLRLSSFYDAYNSFLAVQGHKNDVYLVGLQYSNGVLTASMPEELVKASRYVVSAISWLRLGGKHVLAIHSAFHLHIFLFDDDALVHTETTTLDFLSAACGIVIYKKSEEVVGISVMSCKGETFSYEINVQTFAGLYGGGYAADYLVNFMNERKKKTNSDEGSTAVQSYGFVAHPNGTYAALAYSIAPDNTLRYPIISQQSFRIGFIPLEKSPIIEARSPVEGSSLSLWWEIKSHVKALPPAQRELFMSNIMSRLALTPPAVQTSELLEADFMVNLFSPILDQIRLRSHLDEEFDGGTLILRHLATIVVNYVLSSGLNVDSDLDRAVLLSYASFVPNTIEKIKGPTTIAVSGGFFEEKFDFAGPQQTQTVITSTDFHSWQRCSLTLLPILTTDSLCCSGCDRSIINWSSLKDAPLASRILQTLDTCIYCGCRYYQRTRHSESWDSH